MNSSFITKTIKGGVFFVLPLALVLIIFVKIIAFLKPIAQSISATVDPNENIPFFAYLISLLIILLIFFMGGLLESRFSASKKLVNWVEDNILSMLPAYQLIKRTTQNKMGLQDKLDLPVVLVPTDGWVIAFLVEELSDQEVLVFIPSSPNTYEGSLNIFNNNEIRRTKMTAKDAYSILKKTGIGTKLYFDKAFTENEEKAV